MDPRIVMLVDLDYFFAQCEELKEPVIKARPVVVCVFSGRTEDSGAVSTANYIAREYGVKSGMPIFMAKKRLKDTNAVFLPVDYALYEETSDKVMEILRSFADRFEQVGIDEAYLDVTERANKNFQKGQEIAAQVKNEILRQEKLTCSIGLGPNKLVAKIAADTKKPDGLTVVPFEQATSFLAPLPVSRLIGVGTKTKARMQALGINSILELSRFDMQKLIAVFGKTSAMYFHNSAFGIDEEPVQERGEASSISRIATLQKDSRELDFILEKTDELCKDLQGAVTSAGKSFKTIGITVVTTDMSIHTRSETLENPTNSLEMTKRTVKELLERFFSQQELDVRRVGVKISNFVEKPKNQKQLINFIRDAENETPSS